MSIKSKIFIKRIKAIFLGLIVGAIPSLILHMLGLPFNSVGNLSLFMIISVLMVNYFMRTKKYIIWFRRFHKKELSKLRFKWLLNKSCLDLCIPITIQDSKFKKSYMGIGSKWSWTMMFFGGIILFLPFIALTLIIILLFSPVLDIIEPSHAYLFFGISMTIAAAMMIAVFYFFREELGLAGFYSLDSGYEIKKADFALKKANRVLKKIVRRLFRFQGVLIFKSPDEVWHDVVEFILGKVDGVLIDVTEPSENLVWELENSFKTKLPESIIITFGLKADAPKKLPDTIYKELERITGKIDLANLSIFYYPAEQPPFGLKRFRLYRTLFKELREELGRCVAL